MSEIKRYIYRWRKDPDGRGIALLKRESRNGPVVMYEDHQAALTAERENYEAMREHLRQYMIPVTTQLPKKDVVVLGLNLDGELEDVQYREERQCMLGARAGECGEGFVSVVAGYLPVDNITHWLPLPEPLQAEREKNEALRQAVREKADAFELDAKSLIRDFENGTDTQRELARVAAQALEGAATELLALEKDHAPRS